jgi:ABC-type uncharacterized transport system involved in gliding motility auxiliary subunit
MAARTETRRNALLTIAAVLVGIVALNVVTSIALPFARADLTQDRLYSTSRGVDRTLASLDEPVRIDYFWTQEGSKDQPLLRAHGQRVREYLEEIARRSKGKVEVRFIDPEPFSEAEDEARTAGLPALAVDGSGRTLTLGLVVRGPTDRKETIPYLSPENEPLLEYELMRAIASVGRPTKPKVGLLSTIALEGGMDPRNPMAQRGPPVVIEQLREQADVVDVDATADALPTGIDALVLVQPRKLTEGMLKSIDAWAVAGKPLVVLADPYAETDAGPDAAMMGAKRGGTTYDLGPLLAAWGVDVPKDMVVGDLAYATRVRAPSKNGGVRELDYPAWLSMTNEAFTKDDPLVGGLQSLNLMSPGSIERIEGAKSTLEPLVRTSDRSQQIQSLKLGFFGDPEQLLKDFKSDGVRRTLAARIGGEIASAYPAADGAQVAGKANILLIADADLLADDTWVIDDRVAGMSVGKRAVADNGPLVLNAVELAAGNPALAEIRARGQFRRPFTVVDEMRREAQTKFIAEEKNLQDEIQRTELQIGELQRERTPDGMQQVVLSAEQVKKIEELQQRMVAARKELRAVQLSLRQGVEQLGTRLLVLNAVLWPLAVAAAALTWYVVRGRSSRREASK